MPAAPLRRPEIAWRVIDGEAVVVNPRTGMVFPLNPVATRCWELADGAHPPAAMVQAILEEFDADPADVERDVAGFLAELAAKGLLMPEPAAAERIM